MHINVPFVIRNQKVRDGDCERCREQTRREADAAEALPDMRIVDLPRACVPLDDTQRLRSFLNGLEEDTQDGTAGELSITPLDLTSRSLIFFAGKGGVGKTTSSASVGLQLAASNSNRPVVIISVDPAHALPELLAPLALPANLTVEKVDTKERWKRLREKVGDEIERVIQGLTPSGMSISHDAEVMRELIDVAPPGADEIFAIMRLAELLEDDASIVIVDTAPTGHFLRLLDLPQTAGEWVREFMRLLLRYRELVPPGSLGEQLLEASRALHTMEKRLVSPDCATVVVFRPERIVVEETLRLQEDLQRRGIDIGGRIANYVTPATDCRCDLTLRQFEHEQLVRLGATTVVERRTEPPSTLGALRTLVPMVETSGR
jgi:arsenite-transporting ATPase